MDGYQMRLHVDVCLLNWILISTLTENWFKEMLLAYAMRAVISADGVGQILILFFGNQTT